MKVCILGGGLTALTLAKALVNQEIRVDLFLNSKLKTVDKSRTIGISQNNIEYFTKYILNINPLLWKIKKIEIFNSNLKDKKLLNFKNKNQFLFSMIKNHELNDYLVKNLKKNKFFTVKKKINEKKIINSNYNLIINCDLKNSITKKFFYKKINKDYKAYAHTTIIQHKKILNNVVARQIFTKKGPLAFLPLSEFETAVVYSAVGSRNIDLKSIVKKFNPKYSINKINKISNFELKSSDLRSYYYQNILAFGDLLHKIHPLAGQGFNMTIRDIKEINNLIKFKIDHGLEIDSSICKDFEKKVKHKNFLFSNGIDFIYEIFKLESQIKSSILSKSIQLLGKNEYTNKFFIKFANEGVKI